ncbi:MAG: mannose-1-phosphate guanylyltransferase/mannose-6-phosphate isomerase [Alphaproteobacteria bacterium]|nr:mannose-1-phosphate guanylyltransferase/mannose-6-phosphate isomerase [Alphaproteobacteria bacterium]
MPKFDASKTPFVPVILCGGVGRRLWPVSQEACPKQFHTFGGEHSLLQRTIERAAGYAGAQTPMLFVGADTAPLAREQATALGRRVDMIIEPEGRNTAPAIAAAALEVKARHGGHAVMAILPADHVCNPEEEVHAALEDAATHAQNNLIMTLGVVPTCAETGYGYIAAGDALDDTGTAFTISQFHEKPSLPRAKMFVQSSKMHWNCGVFVATADTLIAELEEHAPVTLACAREALSMVSLTPFGLQLGDVFGDAPAEPFDREVMERTHRAGMIRVSYEWSDVGNWAAIATHPDFASQTDGHLTDCTNVHVSSDGDRPVAAIGLENVVIIDTPDALLVANQDHAQQVGDVAKEVLAAAKLGVNPKSRVVRPWGAYRSLHDGPVHQVKHIEVAPGGQLSLQLHHRRAEHWVVVGGTATVTVGETTRDIGAGEHVFIEVGEVHRLENHRSEVVHLIEVQIGDYLGEDDIVRLEDVYGRAPANGNNAGFAAAE